MLRYAATIFLSAFLLFQVQPIVGKIILPWFGGTPHVWTTCILFFQVLLLCGYGYSHLVASWLPASAQRLLHVAVLGAAAAFVATSSAFNQDWQPTAEEVPQQRIFMLLASTVGLPFFVLSTTGPLLQDWFRRTHPGRSPYRLYSLSNVGSLLALLTYPVLVEPNWRVFDQVEYWNWGFYAFAALCAYCALMLRDRSAEKAAAPAVAAPAVPAAAAATVDARRPSIVDILMWTALSACGSVLLLATTNQMTLDISVVPFLWIMPLALYLISFIICFDNERWYVREFFAVAYAVVLLQYLAAAYSNVMLTMSITFEIALYAMVMFTGVMVCHGELVRSKPVPKFLTLFYLTVSAGGALGGAFVTFVAPNIFDWYSEFALAVLGATLLLIVSVFRDRKRFFARRPPWFRRLSLATALVLLCTSLGIAYLRYYEWGGPSHLFGDRNFFGVIAVRDILDDFHGSRHELTHGRILHGFQLQDPAKRMWNTSYYSDDSGIGMAIRTHPARTSQITADGEPPKPGRPLRIGVIGLGSGSIIALGRPGDYFRFYEINPSVARVAYTPEYFTYLIESPCKFDIVMGDARLNLEREAKGLDVEVVSGVSEAPRGAGPVEVLYETQKGEPQKFDVLVMDGFSSDSIPIHLVTKEAFEIYRQHLQPDGIMAINLSNRFLDLSGVVYSLAEEFKYKGAIVAARGDSEKATESSVWGLITNNDAFLQNTAFRNLMHYKWPPTSAAHVLWTDDYASLWQILK